MKYYKVEIKAIFWVATNNTNKDTIEVTFNGLLLGLLVKLNLLFSNARLVDNSTKVTESNE